MSIKFNNLKKPWRADVVMNNSLHVIDRSAYLQLCIWSDVAITILSFHFIALVEVGVISALIQ